MRLLIVDINMYINITYHHWHLKGMFAINIGPGGSAAIHSVSGLYKLVVFVVTTGLSGTTDSNGLNRFSISFV